MWNSKRTDVYEGMLAETVTVKGYGDDFVHAYYAPLGEGPFQQVLIPHMPGWDEFYRETTRRFAHHGYLAICPDIYADLGMACPMKSPKKHALRAVYTMRV